MKALVIYSSRTGNTRAIAEAIVPAIATFLSDCDLYPVEKAPSAQGYALVAVGYWVDKGMPDSEARHYMETITHSTVALFGTLGAWPDSEHAEECRSRGEALLLQPERGNTVLGTFLCQGKVDPKISEMMQKMPGNVHPMTEERKARLEEAARHPDAEDCRQAAQCFAAFAQTITLQGGRA